MSEKQGNRGGRNRARGFAAAGHGGGNPRANNHGGGGGRGGQNSDGGQQRQPPPPSQAWPSLGQSAPPTQSQSRKQQQPSGSSQQRPQPAQQHYPALVQQQHPVQPQQPRPAQPQQQRPTQPQQKTPAESQAADVSVTPAHRPQRGSTGEPAAGGRGAMRGRRFIPDVLRTRPIDCQVTKQGKSGKPTLLTTNYFRVTRKENESIFQYRVDFNPPVETDRTMKSLIYNLKPVLGGYLFDGTQLFTRHKLRSEEVEYPTKDNTTNQEYIIKLRKVGTVDGTNEMAFVIFNLINRKAMSGLKLQLIGRNFYDPEAKITINQYGIELYPGYITSIRQHEQDVLMCAELAHRVMRVDTCYALFRQCQNQGGSNYKDNYKRLVLGSVVMANYGKGNTYTINDVEFNTSPESSFATSNGNITFLQYFKERYNIVIRDPRQPMLVSRSKPRDIRAGRPEYIYLVPELVRVTGITDDMRKNFNLMRTLADHTRLTPDKRIERLEVFNRRLQQSSESAEVFKFWKTELDRRLVEVTGRILSQEAILFSDINNGIPAGETADWQMVFRNTEMHVTVPLTNWYVIVPSGSEKLMADFLGSLRESAKGMRFQVQDPQRISIANDSPAVYVENLGQVIQKDPQLIMCLVSNDKADRYAAIKKKCCVDRAVPTQVIKTRTITPKGGNLRTLLSVATKVLIQINCKLGGIPWILKNPLTSVMIIGFDVCHDTRDKSKSFGALVASMYGGTTKHPRFFSTVNHHSSGEELSNFMAQNVMKALHSYRGEFGSLPQRIIIYRDGVGEGQMNYVFEHEVGAVKENLNRAYKDNPTNPRFTFFVVNKRINTRLFNQKRNPVPGTIVDDVITLPERNDFYLISQSVRQGTVSPTSYNILFDNSGLSADNLQVLTYKQTHLYYNWSGTVGVPAVCQYAHKLAFLTGQYLHQAPNHLLEKKLYYL
ncbi:protein aubergine-like [Topomyia yanbarensis]|uniref:protein aubergine-like n=1 Tax=Topomyia yanbarensis TaxID=2498891 RepID=UPI00273ABEAF|nr:protein aubergine-like [Topomyia yanbarensis]XP_058838220.1 protein aubergine-like [Topomyia yanbarensis]